MDRLIVYHMGRRLFVRLLSVCCCLHLPMITEQQQGKTLQCLEFLVTCRLWFARRSTLNQRVRSSSLRRPTKFS